MNKYYNEEKSNRLKKIWGNKFYLHWNDDLVKPSYTDGKEIEPEQRYTAEELDAVSDEAYNKLLGKVKCI